MTHRSPCRILLDDDFYIVVQTLPFGVASWRWGKVYVVAKASGRLMKANAAEKIFLAAVVRELARRDAYFPGPLHERLFRRFAESVSLRQSSAWRAFFRREKPRSVALTLSRDSLLQG